MSICSLCLAQFWFPTVAVNERERKKKRKKQNVSVLRLRCGVKTTADMRYFLVPHSSRIQLHIIVLMGLKNQ
jgi:hypothetical protein